MAGCGHGCVMAVAYAPLFSRRCVRRSGTESLQTLRWREVDSKLRSLGSAGPSTKSEQFQGDRQSPKTRNGSHSRAEPEVRIHSAPADSLYLAGFRPPTLKSRAFPAGVRGGTGSTVGRDRRSAAIWRPWEAISLSAKFQYRSVDE